MKKFQIDYEIRSSACIQGIDEQDALRRFKQKNPLADVLYVAAFDADGKEVVGVCEGRTRTQLNEGDPEVHRRSIYGRSKPGTGASTDGRHSASDWIETRCSTCSHFEILCEECEEGPVYCYDCWSCVWCCECDDDWIDCCLRKGGAA